MQVIISTPQMTIVVLMAIRLLKWQFFTLLIEAMILVKLL